MKPQRRPFRVETKRGSSRSAFVSQTKEPDIFRVAEAMLFGQNQTVKSVSDNKKDEGVSAPRRILQALEEPQAPLLPSSYEAPGPRGRKPGSKSEMRATDLAEGRGASILLKGSREKSERRGRSPGSKNRNRPIDLPENARSLSMASVEAQERVSESVEAFNPSDESFASKRRGRPPGSKNKAKGSDFVVTLPKKARNALEALGVSPEDLVPVMAPDDGASQLDRAEAPSRVVRDSGTGPARPRLRDRSKILRRYVWETEPKAGERGYRGRRR